MSAVVGDKIKSVQALAETGSHQLRVADIEDNPSETPRRQVLETLEESLLQYDELYRKLAQ